jgi:GNAT superfamily N-acetyltransferase
MYKKKFSIFNGYLSHGKLPVNRISQIEFMSIDVIIPEMTPTVIIRRANQDDLESITSLAEQLGYPTSTEAMTTRLTDILSTREKVIFVADPGNGKAAGYIQASVHVSLEVDPLVEIDGLVVSRDHRRQGIGGLLIAAVEDRARSLGILTVRLHTNIIREEAHRFYKDLGFTINKTQYSMVKKITE